MDRRPHRRLDSDPLPFHRLAQLSAPLLILLLGVALRVPLLTRDMRFAADEALYATFARRIALHGDILLSGIQLDKPPLLFYSVGGSFALFGVNEFAARLPNLAASLLTLAVVYALTRRLYGLQTAILAMLLLCLSPFDRTFAATVYTDPLLTLFVVAACLAAVRSRWSLAGLLIALAFATKPNALQWLPLVIALGVAAQGSFRGIRRALPSFGFGVALLVIWSIARATTPDFWTLNAFNNTPNRLIRANEVMPRLTHWWHDASAILPVPIIGWLAVPVHLPKSPNQRSLFDLILTTYTLASIVALWLIAFNTYDRYLHTLAPILLILAARVLIGVCGRLFRPRGFVVAVLIACLMPFFATRLGNEADQNAGIDRLAAALNQLPAGSIVYDHWLGWELGFYLGDTPTVQVIWQSTIDDLATAVHQQPGYFVGERDSVQDWTEVLADMGITVRVVASEGNFMLVQLR